MIKKLLYKLIPRSYKIVRGDEARKGGASRSPTDDRDYSLTFGSVLLPQRHDLLPLASPVENQGSLNSCVGHAITTAVEMLNNLSEFPHKHELSRMHVWNEARKLTHGTDWKQNKGVFIRDGWKAAREGITIEKLFPYQPKYSKKELGIAAKIFKGWHTRFKYYFIKGWTSKSKVLQIKKVLYLLQTPVVVGVRVRSGFVHHYGTRDTYKPRLADPLLFGHAFIIVGYDEGRFLIKNSWGPHWGFGGYAWVSEDWIGREAFEISYAKEDDN